MRYGDSGTEEETETDFATTPSEVDSPGLRVQPVSLRFLL